MRSHIYSIAVALLFNVNCFAQTYGLTFSSHEAVLEKRTSLDLSPDDSLCFSKNFDLGFDINFLPDHETYFGYVMRIINGNDQNIDLIYDQKTSLFKVIIGERFSGISFQIDSPQLYKVWPRINLGINLETNVLECFVNGKTAGKSNLRFKNPCFRFLWGANDFQKFRTRDLPPFQLKNIKITEQGKLKYFWPLDEIQGDLCADKISGTVARVKNPNWMKPKHQKWELISSFNLKGFCSVAFDTKSDKLYIAGSDSLAVYPVKTDPPIISFITNAHQNLMVGHQSIYDSTSGKLYDIYIDQKKIIPFDFNSSQWTENFSAEAPITEFWHANKFISSADSSLYVIAGYGQLSYKNQVSRYHFPTRTWEKVTTLGDSLPPRYLAALGTTTDGKYAYILGGYGSHTGDQMLDPVYYYDLYRYDIKNRTFKKIYNLKSPISQFTFANSLILDPVTNEYYALIFPNDLYNSHLQLIKGSLADSTFQMLGNSIAFSFHDIQSYADLFYSPISNKLIAVTLFYSKYELKDQTTQVKIYTVDFPPEILNVAAVSEKPGMSRVMIFLIGLGALALMTSFVFLHRSRIRKRVNHPAESFLREDMVAIPRTESFLHNTERNTPSSIYLFGQFQVIDKEGHDITRLFTPLLKELLLIIAIHTIKNGRGISSEGLNEILWHDKSEKDAKNNRSVNMAKLKTLLEKVGNCVINKEAGFWQLQVIDPEMYIDYLKYTSFIHSSSLPVKEMINPFFEIIRRGPFLFETEYGWLDNTKSEVSSQVIDRCLGYLNTLDIRNEPECIIDIANYIFYFDPLNEDALMYKCKSLILLKRHKLSNNTYIKFIKDYKDIYGEDFGKSFHEIIS
ncbi:MAG: galactose oxidase [Bacteroidota bacterium]|nr:galactose oxidase [Bacteroidota bacterium]